MGDIRIRFAEAGDPPGVAVATLPGPLDARGVAALEELLSSPRGARFRSWVLDLDGVRYLNSMGMGYLVSVHDRLAADGGAMLLANPQPKVKVLLDLMGLTSLMKLHKSVPAALVALRSKAGRPRRAQTSG